MNTITTETTLEILGPYQDENGRIVAMTCAQQRKWAASLGARLMTPAEFDAAWDQADVQLTVAPIHHNSPLDALHREVAPLLSQGLVIAAKTWVDDGSGQPCNYGLLVPPEEVKGGLWKGIRVYLTTVAAYAIQPPGRAHGANHADWSQLGYCCRELGAAVDSDDNLVEVISTQPPAIPPFTRLGDKGEAVKRMQVWLLSLGYALPKYGADGHHGTETEGALDGYRADLSPDTEPAPASDPLDCEFIGARNFRRASRTASDIKWVVLHSTENPIRDGVARAVARWFNGPSAPMASAHYVVGPDETVQGVRVTDVAWAAPGANKHGIQVEQVGQAMKTNWDGEGWAVLERSARLVAALCKAHDIPADFVDADGLQRGEPGITTHWQVTAAFRKSDHADPGGPKDKRFPLERFMQAVKDSM
jgi:peptidoglycan hydrolase-like protein with peptidoglycan-binding domain